MASECACLGTPSIYVNSLKLGYITEEAEKYNLVYDLIDDQEIVTKAVEIIQKHDKGPWQEKRKRFLSEKIDVTDFIVTIADGKVGAPFSNMQYGLPLLPVVGLHEQVIWSALEGRLPNRLPILICDRGQCFCPGRFHCTPPSGGDPKIGRIVISAA